MRRLYVPLPDDPRTARLTLRGGPHHHLVHVLRAQVGQELELFDGRGRSVRATVAALGEAFVELVLLGEPRLDEAPARRITLVQGLPKADKLEWVLQKGTELNASLFWPVQTERAVAKLPKEREAARLERWRRIVEEAARQCGRSDVPEVRQVQPLLAAAEALAGSARLLVLDEEEQALPLSQAEGVPGDAPLALVVGPEGGLSRAEVAALRERGATPVTLGPLVLRTETAGLAALAVLRHLEGRLG